MANSELAKEEKIKTWKVFEQQLGTIGWLNHSLDWRITEDSKTSIIIKFSKYDDKSHNYWYGFNPDNLEKWSDYEHSYIVFLIGNHQERLVIPIKVFESFIKKANIKLSKGNQIKLHITSEKERYFFTEFKDFDTSEFYQKDVMEVKQKGTLFAQDSLTPEFEVSQPVPVSAFKDDTKEVISKIEDEIEFNPQNIEDARKKIYTSIAVRRGQQKFRQMLIEAYEGKCAVTGCEVKETLEAAHIIPYKGEHTNKLGNGILLRADIHTLFDLGLIAIDTNTMSVILAPTLINTDYNQFNGVELKVSDTVLIAIKPALDERLVKFYNSTN
ncbi:MAG TPA: HNH endonuclease [Pyrinomonadaceae bacterium]|nr:HNH endonuclease [Pyrinomonadaceae bacterium]